MWETLKGMDYGTHRSHCWDKYTLEYKKFAYYLFVLNRCLLYIDVGSIQMLALYRCLLFTDIDSIQMLVLYRCWLDIDISSIQMFVLCRCWIYTDVCSIQILALYRCWLYSGICSIQMLALYRCWLYTNVSPSTSYLTCKSIYLFWKRNILEGLGILLLKMKYSNKNVFTPYLRGSGEWTAVKSHDCKKD